MNLRLLLLEAAAILVVTGFLLVRSSRKCQRREPQSPPTEQPGESVRICPDATCGEHNRASAVYCSRCGKSLQSP